MLLELAVRDAAPIKLYTWVIFLLQAQPYFFVQPEIAVLLAYAKLTTGELALGDLWFGGRTRTPWNPAQGSSGSSSGRKMS